MGEMRKRDMTERVRVARERVRETGECTEGESSPERESVFNFCFNLIERQVVFCLSGWAVVQNN